MRTPHTICRRGKRVRIALRTGEVFVDKFVERRGRVIVLETRTVAVREVRSFGYNKAKE